MSRHDPKTTLLQLRDFLERMQSLYGGATLETVLSNWRDTWAFERAVELLGEAVKRLPEELRKQYPAVPWKQIAGMRDRVSHGYDAIDYQILWDAVQHELPALRKVLEQMLRDLDSPPAS